MKKVNLVQQNVIRNVRLPNTWPPFREGGAGGILINRTSARESRLDATLPVQPIITSLSTNYNLACQRQILVFPPI